MTRQKRRAVAREHQHKMIGNGLGVLHVDARAGIGNVGNHTTEPLIGGQRHLRGEPQGLPACDALFPDHGASVPPGKADAFLDSQSVNARRWHLDYTGWPLPIHKA
jgi:hypothetical protein